MRYNHLESKLEFIYKNFRPILLCRLKPKKKIENLVARLVALPGTASYYYVNHQYGIPATIIILTQDSLTKYKLDDK